MTVARGVLSHIDFSVGNPGLSIHFYDVLLTGLGYNRYREPGAAWQEPQPTRAAWGVQYGDGTSFAIDLRPAGHNVTRTYNRFEPGPHHMAFSVDSDAEVDEVYRSMVKIDATVLDAPFQYGGQPGYGAYYYAVFFADPDGFKVEVVHL